MSETIPGAWYNQPDGAEALRLEPGITNLMVQKLSSWSLD